MTFRTRATTLQKQTYRYQAHYGVVFKVTSFTVKPADIATLRQLFFCEVGTGCYKLTDLIVDTYDRMLAGQRFCEMVVAISNPLTREQADQFNQQRIKIASVAAGAFGLAAKPLGWFGAPAGPAAASFVHNHLDTRHAGDVMVAVDAKVQGGIGPQHTSTSVLIKVKGGNQ
jgi:hypothetical protein